MLKLPGHGRYDHVNITQRPDYTWPDGKRLAFYIALNIEHFAFGAGLGMDPHSRGGGYASVRFDVVSVLRRPSGLTVEHLRGAF